MDELAGPDRSGAVPLETRAVIEVAALRAALRAFLAESDRMARASGLTPQRHLLLLMIKGAPDGSERATVSELVERLKLAQNTVTELVQRAERLGLVEREQSARDARVAHHPLSAEGERRLALAFEGNAGARTRLLRAMRAPAG
jgi:DNA-binding MarR family transcriptional regulator